MRFDAPAATAFLLLLGATACSLVMSIDGLRQGDAPVDSGAATADAPQGEQLLREDFEGFALATDWGESSSQGPAWFSSYLGGGATGIERDASQVLSLAPRAAGAGESWSALVRTTARFGDLELSIRMKTVAQLRTKSPEPTEAAQVLWHLDDREDRCNYLLLTASGGWEIGKKALASGEQQVLASGTGSLVAGAWHAPRIRQVGATITVWLDDAPTPRSAQDPEPTEGTIGLYVDDAHAHFDDVLVVRPQP